MKFFLRALTLAAFTSSGFAQISVLTAQYDNSRSATNLNETILNVANVSPTTFGKLFSRHVDSEIYAHPLIVQHVSIPRKGMHNVVYVATGNNAVYAFDADTAAQSAPLWSRNLGPSVVTGGGDVQPNWGILSTPVIGNGVMYVTAVPSSNETEWPFYLAALNITTGEDKYGPPAQILFPNGSGQVVSATPYTIQRAALLAANNMIYIGFANFQAPTVDAHLFVWDLNDVLRAYTFNGTSLSTTPLAVGSLAPDYTGGVSVSANGSTVGSGIEWATSTTATEETLAPGTLHAYDASNISHELWNSDMNAARDAMGTFTKFSIPVVANSKVYVITESNELQVYGMLPLHRPKSVGSNLPKLKER